MKYKDLETTPQNIFQLLYNVLGSMRRLQKFKNIKCEFTYNMDDDCKASFYTVDRHQRETPRGDIEFYNSKTLGECEIDFSPVCYGNLLKGAEKHVLKGLEKEPSFIYVKKSREELEETLEIPQWLINIVNKNTLKQGKE